MYPGSFILLNMCEIKKFYEHTRQVHTPTHHEHMLLKIAARHSV